MAGMWHVLIVGSFAAVGAALAVGTLAALVRYHRTGAFPTHDGPVEVSTGRLVALWARVVVGLALAGAGLASLAAAGQLRL